MKTMLRAALMLAVLSLVTGVAYPLAVTAIAQTFFRDQANGCRIVKNGHIIGSRLVGQAFTSDRYFWPRPSATGYSALPSGGSNFSPASNALKQAVTKREIAFRSTHALSPDDPVPLEMLFASASGLDPDISRQSAELQIGRVAAARGFDEGRIRALRSIIAGLSHGGRPAISSGERVNTVILNCALDSLAEATP